MIRIAGLKKSDVLRVLYDNARPQGLGFLHYREGAMTSEQAEKLLSEYSHFDYVHGRVMKVDLSKDDRFDESLYDRDNGQGAAARAIDTLRS